MAAPSPNQRGERIKYSHSPLSSCDILSLRSLTRQFPCCDNTINQGQDKPANIFALPFQPSLVLSIARGYRHVFVQQFSDPSVGHYPSINHVSTSKSLALGILRAVGDRLTSTVISTTSLLCAISSSTHLKLATTRPRGHQFKLWWAEAWSCLLDSRANVLCECPLPSDNDLSVPEMSRLQVLPQEISGHIIDLVVTSDKDWKRTLRGCSIVSKAFHPQARRHLFSHIEFLADDSANKRAGRLLKVITLETNRYLLTSIHSITLLLETHSGYDFLPQNSLDIIIPSIHPKLDVIYRKVKAVWRKMARKIESRNNYMAQLLELFIQLPIRRLALDGLTHRTWWNEFCRSHYEADFAGFLSRIACNPAFTTLTFKDITNPPRSFSTEPVHFPELLLDNITGFEFETAQDSDFPCFINVTKLQITNSSSQFAPLSLPSSYFPHLTALIVSVPRYRHEMPIVQFILDTSHSLESLELHDIHYRVNNPINRPWGPRFLTHFNTLHHLKFKARCQLLEYLHDKLAGIVSFLASATSPIPLGSITIELLIDHRSRTAPMLWEHMPFEFPALENWATLDAALSNPVFAHLSQVTLAFRVFDDEPWPPIPTARGIKSYLPTLCASPSITFEAIVETGSFTN